MKRVTLTLALAALLGTAGCLNVAPNVSPSVKVNKDVEKRVDELERRTKNLERRVALVRDAKPELMIGYHKPTLPAFEDYVFDLIDGLLSTGRTSRLHRRLVEEKQVAVGVSTFNGVPGGIYPNLFTITATPRAPHTAAEVEAEIDAELARLTVEPVAADEIARVKNQLRAQMIRGLQSNEGLASTLAYFETVAGDWRYMTTHLEQLDRIAPEDIRAVAAKYFRPENRTVAVIVTEPDPAAGE